MQVTQGWQTFQWLRFTLLSYPTATLIRLQIDEFSDSTLCVGISIGQPNCTTYGLLTRFGEGLIAQSYTCTRRIRRHSLACMRAKHIEDCRVGIEEWLVKKLRLRKDFGSVNYQIHQPVFQSHHHPQREARTTPIMEPSVIKPTNMTSCSRQVHQPQNNHGQTDHGLKKINHGKVFG